MTDTTDFRERKLLLYDTWVEGSFVKVCLRLATFFSLTSEGFLSILRKKCVITSKYTCNNYNIPEQRVLLRNQLQRMPEKTMTSLEVLSLMTDTTDFRERKLLLYDTWVEGSFVKVCLRLATFRIDDFFSF